MKLSQLEFTLPKELIAHSPISPRDHSKLMVINKSTQKISHKHFYDLVDILTANDVLVFNQTKVFPAKYKHLLLIREIRPLVWKCMYKGKPQIEGGKVLEVNKNFALIEFEKMPEGTIPLPPYIHSPLSESQLKEKYQTVYAKETGSIAAPTAGFHFTKKLLKKLKDKGIQMEFVTLHVGIGTFLPIKTDDITKHIMHSEQFTLTPQAAFSLNEAKKTGKRIIAVGTTTTRVLETSSDSHGNLEPQTNETNIFIYPPYKFKFIDGLITNFHLPHSTLLALVSALAGEELIKKAYQKAIENKYRFYSFGDASLII